MEKNNVLKVVIGSWYAYNSCNKHAYGSKWIDLLSFEDSDDLLNYLQNEEGWSEKETEELFLQDYESDFFHLKKCNNINPCSLLDILKEVDEDDYTKLQAITEEIEGDFEKAIELLDNYIFYENMTAEEYEEDLINSCIDFSNLGWLSNYINIDYEAIAKDDDNVFECCNGVLVAC
jgi:hypothetical protein